jgi:3-deoxy-7-phosphoheptulonate synthase
VLWCCDPAHGDTEVDLGRASASRVDPRLPYEQDLEMALVMARTVAKRNGREI